MDQPPPNTLPYATPPPALPRRPLVLVVTGLSTVFIAALFGAVTNAINGIVSAIYFENLGIAREPHVWTDIITQGVLEGTAFGLLFSFVVTTTIGLITRATCTYPIAVKWVGRIVACDFALWLLGGVSGVALAALAPTFFSNTFPAVPGDPTQMLRFAWVGGSIWGEEFAGLLATGFILTLFHIQWQRGRKNEPQMGTDEHR